MRQPGLVDGDNSPVRPLLRHGMEMVERPDRRCHQPREPKQRVDQDKDADHDGVLVIRVAVLQLVARVVDEVPGDSVVQEDQHEGKQCCSGKRNT